MSWFERSLWALIAVAMISWNILQDLNHRDAIHQTQNDIVAVHVLSVERDTKLLQAAVNHREIDTVVMSSVLMLMGKQGKPAKKTPDLKRLPKTFDQENQN